MNRTRAASRLVRSPPKEPEKVLFDPDGQTLHRFIVKLSGKVRDRSQVGGMVDRFRAARFLQRMGNASLRRQLIRRVGLDQQPVGGYMPKGLSLAGFAFVGKIAGEREKAPSLARGATISRGPPKQCNRKPRSGRGPARSRS